MTREEAKDVFLNRGFIKVEGCRGEIYHPDKWREACVVISEWLKSPEQEPKWIPVSERLPEENKTVIASTKYGVYPEARYTKEDGWEWAYESGADYWVELEYVTAWMPLPEPYREVEK